MKCWESWSNLFLVCAVALPVWRIYYESFSSSFCTSPRDSCPEMRVISNYVSVILQQSKLRSNALFVVQTAFHITELKWKKKKGLNRHKVLFCHFGIFCFMFVWLRFSSYFLVVLFNVILSCFSFFRSYFGFVLFFFCHFFGFFFLSIFLFFSDSDFFFLIWAVHYKSLMPLYLPSSFIWAWDQQDFSGMYRSILAEL